MKKPHLILITTLFLQSILAQVHKVEATVSEESTKKGGMFTSLTVDIFHIDDQYIYGKAYKGFLSTTPNLIVFDKNTLNELSVTPFFPKDFNGVKNPKITELRAFEIDGKAYVSYLWKKPKAKTSTRCIQAFENGNLVGSPNELYVLKEKQEDRISTFENENSFYLNTYYWDRKTYTSYDDKYLFYDTNYELIADKEVKLPFERKNIRKMSETVTKDGSIYYFVEYSDREEKITKQNPLEKSDVSYHFLNYSINDNEATPFEFDFDKYFIQTLKYEVKDNIIYCGGIFGEDSPYEISGSFAAKFNAETGDEISLDVQEFDKKFIEEFYTEKQVEKAEKKGKDLEAQHVVFYDIIVNDDGSYYLVGEYYYDYQVCYTDSKGNTRCYTVYVHNDIIVIKVDNDGEIEWTNKIPRKSSSTYDPLVAYAYKKVGNDIVFIYYDSKNNFNVTDVREVEPLNFGKKQEVELVATTLYPDGDFEKYSVMDYKSTDYKLTLYPGLVRYYDGSFYTQGIEEKGKITTKRKVLVKLQIE